MFCHVRIVKRTVTRAASEPTLGLLARRLQLQFPLLRGYGEPVSCLDVSVYAKLTSGLDS